MSISQIEKPLNIAIAGSTAFSSQATQALLNHQSDKFQLISILTPSLKPVGRHQTITPNHLHQLAIELQVPHILIDRPLKHSRQQINDLLQPSVDVLLVVDFGYLIPQWLLDIPKLATINIHPSKLPEWRGSSPGQCVLLSGSQTSAVTIMQLDTQLDHGPILNQVEFSVAENWTTSDYYQHAFNLACNKLPHVIIDLANQSLTPIPQPDYSPTPLARLLTKNDGFVPFSLIHNLIEGSHTQSTVILDVIQDLPTLSSPHSQINTQASSLLSHLYPLFCQNRQLDPIQLSSLATYLSQATRALSPWPGLWTEIPTKKGAKVMKILSCNWNNQTNRLVLEKVQIASQQPALWNQVKNVLVKN